MSTSRHLCVRATFGLYGRGDGDDGLVGSHWAFWQSGLMSIAILVFWLMVIWIVYAFVTSGSAQDAQP